MIHRKFVVELGLRPAEVFGTRLSDSVSRPAELQDAVTAARSRFLNATEEINKRRLALALQVFGQNRFAHASQVLAPLLDGWQELMILLAKDYFSTKMRVIGEKHFRSGAIPWANSQTRSAMDEAFGTNWFSAPEPKLDAVSRVVASLLREIDERLFVPPRKSTAGPLPPLADGKAWDAIFLQRVHSWRGHGWLVTWLPSPPAAFNHYVDNPLEPLTDEVQTSVVCDITLYLFDGIERALKDVVDLALVDQACSIPAVEAAFPSATPIDSEARVVQPVETGTGSALRPSAKSPKQSPKARASKQRAKQVAKVLEELVTLKAEPQFEILQDFDAAQVKFRRRQFYVFEAAVKSPDIKALVLDVKKTKRAKPIGLAIQIVSIAEPSSKHTVARDWNRHKPSKFRNR
jgi:hypothetical protein